MLHLTNRLRLEIIAYLNPDLNAQTLLAVALCARVFRDAAQKALFSGLMFYNELDNALEAHTKFLQAILASRDRLALYVHSYASYATNGRLRYKKERLALWSLTSKALPLLKNLKNLYLKPALNDPSTPNVLKGCTFQLESFTGMGDGNEEALFNNFLVYQHRSLHLNIDSATLNNTTTLPAHLCPALVSAACTFSELAHITTTRPITAFHAVTNVQDLINPVHIAQRPEVEEQRLRASLKRLTFLHAWTIQQLQPLARGIVFENVSVPEITRLEGKTLPSNVHTGNSRPESLQRLLFIGSVRHSSP